MLNFALFQAKSELQNLTVIIMVNGKKFQRHKHVCTYVHRHTQACTNTHTHKNTHASTHVNTHTCTHQNTHKHTERHKHTSNIAHLILY